MGKGASSGRGLGNLPLAPLGKAALVLPPPPSPETPAAAAKRAPEEQFLKTKLCAFWQENRCLRGSACRYAHGEHELHDKPDLSKTALCRNMLTMGECTVEGCSFAHTRTELRCTGAFYKTTICKLFRHGRCRLGKFCRHAHSDEELRQGSLTSTMVFGIDEAPETAANSARGLAGSLGSSIRSGCTQITNIG